MDVIATAMKAVTMKIAPDTAAQDVSRKGLNVHLMDAAPVMGVMEKLRLVLAVIMRSK